jgi:SagB-type dehydrogenase family enzyme
MGLSAWKAAGTTRWPLRINPSSGNLHPTETHLIIPSTDDLDGGVYHYSPLAHALEKRADIPKDLWQQIRDHFETDGFMVGLSSIFWRESWKYGERAFRYCNHDVGHAIAALSISANLMGWKATYLDTLSDTDLIKIFGFGKTNYLSLENEHPDLLCFVHATSFMQIPGNLPAEIISSFDNLSFHGHANQLSQNHVNWKIIYDTADQSRKPATKAQDREFGLREWFVTSRSSFSAAEIIRKRRSATAFDSKGAITKNQLFSILDKTLMRGNCAPFDVKLMAARSHLVLFLHNVAGLTSGLYFFFRNDNDIRTIQQMSRPDFAWKPVENDFPLFLLKEGNYRRDAMMISCHQEIAGYSAFSLGMISKFSEAIEGEPFRYRHLFWETGMIGQVLYLEAEAHGHRGTGIGCFFDDAVHELLGFEGNRFQSLYHFTIGLPVEDPRLSTHPPYDHLRDR